MLTEINQKGELVFQYIIANLNDRPQTIVGAFIEKPVCEFDRPGIAIPIGPFNPEVGKTTSCLFCRTSSIIILNGKAYIVWSAKPLNGNGNKK